MSGAGLKLDVLTFVLFQALDLVASFCISSHLRKILSPSPSYTTMLAGTLFAGFPDCGSRCHLDPRRMDGLH